MNGILIVNKEKDFTSRDVVNKLVKVFNTKKIGHTGTLDPLAEGVLVVTIGRYTKLGDVLTSTYKEYIATMELGKETDTLDNTGNVLKTSEVRINEEEIKDVIMSYQKKYLQEVPIYSAVKVNGRKLYEYARTGESVELPKKEVDISEIEILNIEDNIVKFRCVVSKGTYIRSLIRDIGASLGVGAIMTDLIRTKQGKFKIEDAYSLEDIMNNNYKLLCVEDVLDAVVINDYEDIEKIRNGVKIEYETDKEFILFKENNKEVALYHKSDEYYRMFLMLENKE